MNIKKYKYLLILILALFIGCNKTYAYDSKTSCYYKSGDIKVYYTISYNASAIEGTNELAYGSVSEGRLISSGTNLNLSGELSIKNWGGDAGKFKGVKFTAVDKPKIVNGQVQCPQYAVVFYNSLKRMYITNDKAEVDAALSEWSSRDKKAYYATSVSSSEFWGMTCSGEECELGQNATVTCTTLFGSEDPEETSLGEMISTALTIVQTAVPILIILLGTIDMAKAAIASKEEEMKKAQTAFVKRLIAGVVVFFIPLIINIVMGLAENVWEEKYSTCELTEITK